MCWLPSRAPLGVRRWRDGRTQTRATRTLISWAIQVGRRDRADAISLSSDAGSLARSFWIASPAFSGPSQASARTASPAARPGKISCQIGACRNSTVCEPNFKRRLGPDVR